MHSFVFGLLSVLCILKGFTSVNWDVVVQPQVNGFMGQNVILPCAFKHPKQDTYRGKITVKWIQRNFPNPVFYCSVQNQTDEQNHNCSNPGSLKRFWLHGNPRKGSLSLGINDSQFTDIQRYICRVELDYESYQSKISTLLNITAPAEILNLTLDSVSKAQGDRLKCIARGNPVPSVKWISSAKSLENIPISKTEHSEYTVISSIPISGKDVYTCQAVNSLGQTEKTFPPKPLHGSGLLVWIGVLGCLLFLGMFVVVGVVLRRERSTQRAMSQNANLHIGKICIDPANESPIYANVNCHQIGERRLPPEMPVRCLDESIYGHSKESTYIKKK